MVRSVDRLTRLGLPSENRKHQEKDRLPPLFVDRLCPGLLAKAVHVLIVCTELAKIDILAKNGKLKQSVDPSCALTGFQNSGTCICNYQPNVL